LRGAGDHVLDEVTVSGGVDDGEDGLGGLELPKGNVDGDTALALGLEFVENPGVLEGGLTHLFFFFFFLGSANKFTRGL
jgi:hypothetical protein